MAISHADHNHPNTPAARAACRKALNNGDEVATTDGKWVGKPAQMTVVPRKRGDGGVVKGMIAAKPDGDQGVVKARKAKAYERPIRTVGDLPADIPVTMASTALAAVKLGYPVVEGMRLNDGETRILIGGPVAQVSLVFNAGGDSGVFVRSLTSSVTHRCDSGPQAMALASGDEEWPWVAGGKLV